MNVYGAQPFEPTWSPPHPRFLRGALPPAPSLPLDQVFGPNLAAWVREAAEGKGAPADYVFGTLLAVSGSLIGNSRLASPWNGWCEPPGIFCMCIGNPSAGKSPAMDAVLDPLRQVEKPLRQAAQDQLEAWQAKAEVAKVVETAWRESVKTAVKQFGPTPDRPTEADPGPEPHVLRLVINDSTIEKLARISAAQPKGTLMLRDELTGFLDGMTRYAGGGTDRPFWLEAYGGRGYTVERVNHPSLSIDRLLIGVIGGIQPDRLNSLLVDSDDDGLLARFIPIWPDAVPIKRPDIFASDTFIKRVLEELQQLDMVTDEHGEARPQLLLFTENAKNQLDEFRDKVRGLEGTAEGLLLSFMGKMPGLSIRISLILAFLDFAAEGAERPREITPDHYGRAAYLVEHYILPMARRAYAGASVPEVERSALRLVALVRKKQLMQFSSRQVLRGEHAGLHPAEKLNPVLRRLEEADCIRQVEIPAEPNGGRPEKRYLVNPALLE